MKFIQIENGGYVNVQCIQYVSLQYIYSYSITVRVNGDSDGYVYKTFDDEAEAKKAMDELMKMLESCQ